MAQQLLQDAACARRAPRSGGLAAELGAGALGLEQLRQLLERQAEQIAQADDLPDPLDVGLGVERGACPRARSAPRAEQPDLLVVADRPRRGAGQLGDLADPQRRVDRGARRRERRSAWRWRSSAAAATVGPRRQRLAAAARSRRGRHVLGSGERHDRADHRDAGQAPQRRVHVRDERRQLRGRRCGWPRPEKTLNSTSSWYRR